MHLPGSSWLFQFSARLNAALSPARRTMLKPISSVLGSVLALLILVEATRRGLLPDIAGYAAGASVGALVAAVAGSGTSLAYVTGNEIAQRSVRRVRHQVVAPSMTLVVIGAGILYYMSTGLQVASVLCGGFTVVLNNLAELESASLERKLETPRLLIASVFSKSFGLAFILLGGGFSVAMLASSAVNFVVLRKPRRGARFQKGESLTLLASLRTAYAPSLMSFSVLGVVVNRAVLIVAPFVLTLEEAGALSLLISAQQSIAAVLISGLYTLMAAHAELGVQEKWMRKTGARLVRWSGLAALGSALAAPLVVTTLNLGHVGESTWWWVWLGLGIFPYSYNRRVQYAYLGAGNRGGALVLLGLICVYTLIVVALGLALASPMLFAVSLLASESCGAATFRVWCLFRGSRAKPAL